MYLFASKTRAPIGAREVKLEIIRPTYRPTDRQTDIKGHGEVSQMLLRGAQRAYCNIGPTYEHIWMNGWTKYSL